MNHQLIPHPKNRSLQYLFLYLSLVLSVMCADTLELTMTYLRGNTVVGIMSMLSKGFRHFVLNHPNAVASWFIQDNPGDVGEVSFSRCLQKICGSSNLWPRVTHVTIDWHYHSDASALQLLLLKCPNLRSLELTRGAAMAALHDHEKNILVTTSSVSKIALSEGVAPNFVGKLPNHIHLSSKYTSKEDADATMSDEDEVVAGV